ncbi:hypothetical protein TRICI_000511 [Trichomonascus ciferrii]|uniref:Uncharacterized protein n=1 Tax=Trichomonascus ciferrii TaxID=44093 RepID=A0A642VD78_9ASCO|nr:hypothetical protein TRICI_000511 [Trichomonascus ciferrii]
MDNSEILPEVEDPQEYNCSCGELEDTSHILVRYGQYENVREVLRQASPEPNSKVHLDSIKGPICGG